MKFSDQIKHSNTDEWFTLDSSVWLIVPYLRTNGYQKILCPFDKEDSAFVQVLEDCGFEVKHSHIDEGSDFFDFDDFEEFDAVVSNPPFSKRQKILEKLFEVGIPFALIMNFNGLFDAKNRWELFRRNRFELLVPQGRMKFKNDEGIGNSPNFQSIYVCSQMLENQIEFADGSLYIPPRRTDTRVDTLMAMGATKEEAVQILELAEWNLDTAAAVWTLRNVDWADFGRVVRNAVDCLVEAIQFAVAHLPELLEASYQNMRITGYEVDEDKLSAVYITDETRGIEQKKYIEDRPHGEWIIRRNRRGKHIYSVCSRCNVAHLDTDFPNFCDNCGADMRQRVLDQDTDGAGKDGNVKEGEADA